MKMMKRMPALFCILLLLCGLLLPAGAEGPEWTYEAPPTETECTLSYDTERLFTAYARSMLNGRPLTAFQTARRSLNGLEKAVYDAVAAEAKKVADGKRTGTVFTYAHEDEDFALQWTEAELGIPFLDENSQPQWDAISEAVYATYSYDGGKVMNALFRDHPYEFYWVSNRVGLGYTRPGMNLHIESQMINGERQLVVMTANEFSFCLPVDVLFAGAEEYTVDPARTGAVLRAVENAQAIIRGGSGMSDFERLRYYASRLRELSEYNHDAAAGYADSTGPWQMIWALDGDPATKVVCEGFSEAFQYLCDNTDFLDGELAVSTVQGALNGGGHEWNMVHTRSGNYLVDVTNCVLTGGSNLAFFETPVSGSVQAGYVINGWVYTFDDPDSDPDLLTLAAGAYTQPETVNISLTLPVGKTVALRDSSGYVPGVLSTRDSDFTVKAADRTVASADGYGLVLNKAGSTEVTLTGEKNTVRIAVTAVNESALNTFVLPGAVTVLERQALFNTAAQRVVLPVSLISAAEGAMDGMDELFWVSVPGENAPAGLPDASSILYLCSHEETVRELDGNGLHAELIY